MLVGNETKDISDFRLLTSSNAFFYSVDINGKIYTYTCRDQFASAVNTANSKNFYIYCGRYAGKEGNVDQFLKFFEAVEKLLQIEDSLCLKTKNPSVVWVQPSNFWNECWVRRSLLSLLLRAGGVNHMDKIGLETILFSGDNLLSCTKLAVMRFISGFTKYNGDVNYVAGRGWYSLFAGKNRDYVIEMLVSNNKSPKLMCFKGKEQPIWC